MRASEVPTMSVEALIPYARNSRTHSEVQVAQIAASIREFGFTNPVLIDGEGGIIAGHGRVLAAQRLGLEAVPVLVLDHLTDAQRRAYVIADNKLALNGGWNEELLAEEVERLLTEGEGLVDLLGFDEAELAELAGLAVEAEADLDTRREPAEPRFNYQEQFGIIVICAGEAEQQKAFEALTALGYECKVVVT